MVLGERSRRPEHRRLARIQIVMNVLRTELGRRYHCLDRWEADGRDLVQPRNIPITIEMVLDCSDRPRLPVIMFGDHVEFFISLRLRQVRAFDLVIGHLIVCSTISVQEHCTC